MFNQTSINDFFPKGNGGDKSGITKTKNGSIQKFFNSNNCNQNETGMNSDRSIKIDENNKESDNKFKNIFSGENIIERVEVFTDGSTVNNGKKNASGGIGVFFYENEFKNLAERYNSHNVTNQKCEILAIFKGLKIIKSKFGRHSKKINVMVHTDSDYCIKCMTSYVNNWLRNNWKLKNGGNVKNRNLIELLLNMTKEFNNVSYNHVKAHTIEPENKNSIQYKMWYGNMMADKLANEGRKKNLFKK